MEHIGFSDVQSALVWQQEVEQMTAELPQTAGSGTDFEQSHFAPQRINVFSACQHAKPAV